MQARADALERYEIDSAGIGRKRHGKSPPGDFDTNSVTYMLLPALAAVKEKWEARMSTTNKPMTYATIDTYCASYPRIPTKVTLDMRIPMMPPGYSNPNPRTVPI